MIWRQQAGATDIRKFTANSSSPCHFFLLTVICDRQIGYSHFEIRKWWNTRSGRTMDGLSTCTGRTKAQRTAKIAIGFALLAAIQGAGSRSESLAAGLANEEKRPQVTLCAPNEVVLASCLIRRKLVSVCGLNRRATYRFGSPGRIELTATALHHASQMFAGGGESQVVVTRGNYRYVIYDRATRLDSDRAGRRPLQFASGIMILRNGRHLSDTKCGNLDKDIINTALLPNYMPRGNYVWPIGMGPASLPPITRR